jgi:hypothetical protein
MWWIAGCNHLKKYKLNAISSLKADMVNLLAMHIMKVPSVPPSLCAGISVN